MPLTVRDAAMSTPPAFNADNRQSPRRSVSWRARLLLSTGAIVECRAIDTSVGGLGLISEVFVAVDERVQVALQVPHASDGTRSIEVHEGVIVACVLTPHGYRLGVRTADPLQELLDEIPGF